MEDSLASYRHDLLTPVNHIIGYCEMLIEDAEGSGLESALAGLKTILDNAGKVLEDIEISLPRGGSEADLVALGARLRPPLTQILAACDGMHWGADPGALEQFAEDLAKVRAAAASLIDLAAHAPAEGPGTSRRTLDANDPDR